MTRHLSIVALLCCAGAASAADLSSFRPSNPTTGAGVIRANEYQLDPGSFDNSVGLTSGGNIVFLNRFTVTAGANVLNSASIAFGTPTSINGASIIVGAWSVTGTGGIGALLGSTTGTIQNASANVPVANAIFNTYNLGAINLGAAGTDFFLGFIVNGQVAGTFPGAINQTGFTPNRSYAGFGAAPLTAAGLAAGATTFGTIDSFGLGGNWLIRGNAVPTPGAAALFGLAGLAGLRRRR